MATIQFENGTKVNFAGTPTPQDVEEVAQKLNLKKSQPTPTPAPYSDLFSRLGTSLQQRATNIVEGVKKGAELASQATQAYVGGEQSGIETIGQVAGGVAGAAVTPFVQSIGGIFDTLKNVLPQGPVPSQIVSGADLTPQVKQMLVAGLNQGIQTLAQKGPQAVTPEEVGMIAQKYQAAVKQDPAIARDLAASTNLFAAAFGLKDIEAGVQGLGELPGKVSGAASDFASGVAQIPKRLITTTGNAVKDVVAAVTEKAPQYENRVSQWLASEPSQQVKTILQETPKAKFDEYLTAAREAAVDPRKPSVFEKVGDTLSDATKQLKSQASSIGAQKSAIIERAKVGLEPFTEAPRKAILSVMKMDQNPLKNEVLDILKKVETKLDADKAIDKIQSLLYDARGRKLIAEGSAAEKQLKGILRTMNEELKNSLPKAYRDLNAKFAERTKVIGTLNRALGEVVEGVPTRGASLIKQFFSPAGTKTKELFDYIKRTTGVDLAQETTIAKFLGEVFDDPKVRSLLQGIPSTRRGLINKAVNFVAEKSGAMQKIEKAIQEGTIQKAKELLLPSEKVNVIPKQIGNSLEENIKLAQEAKPELVKLTNRLAQKFDGEAKVGPNKLAERIQAKSDSYYGGDTSRNMDYIRSTIVMKDMKNIEGGLEELRKLQVPGREIKNFYDQPTELGYRGILANPKLSNGHIGEVQISSPEILKFKKGRGHDLYKEYREIQERIIKEDRPATQDEIQKSKRLIAESKKGYELAFRKDFKR